MRLLLLIPIALLGLATAGALASTHKTGNAVAVGKITSLNSTSIAVRKGHPLTCTIGVNSPDTSVFKIGERVRIDCVDGVLVEIAGKSSSQRTSVTGTIKAHGGDSITIDGQHDVTCKLDDDSPGLDGHKLGELVTVSCLHGVLVTLAKTSDSPTTTGISGTVTALGSTSITVHDGDRDLTCTIGSSSPGLGDAKVGDHLKIGCVNGVLAAIGKPDGPPATTTSGSTTTTTTGSTAYTNLNGTISSLGTASITVHDGDRDLTCTIGSSSPSTSGFAIGNAVRMYCLNGALYYLAHNDDTPHTTTTAATTTTTTTTTTTSAEYTSLNGTISALGSSSITVHSSEHDLTCTIGSSSPSTSGFSVANAVRMYCLNGALYYLAHNDTPPTTTTTAATTTTATTTTSPTTTSTSGDYTYVTGTLSALSSSSITVHTDHDLTCTIGSSSPSVSGFAIGNGVRMYCLSGALYAINHT